MIHIDGFTPDGSRAIWRALSTLRSVFPSVDYDVIRWRPGGYAPHGQRRGHYDVADKAIVLYVNPVIGVVRETPSGFTPSHGMEDMARVVLHELGHHSEHQVEPAAYQDISAGRSTHTRPSWIYVTCALWSHIHGLKLDAVAVGRLVANKRGPHYKSVLHALCGFTGFDAPPGPVIDAIAVRTCPACGVLFQRRRRDAVTCSPACRIRLHRRKKRRHSQHDQQEEFAILRTLAEVGFAEAQFDVGRVYETGLGIRADADEAIAWYEKAAAQGLPHAIAAVKRLRR